MNPNRVILFFLLTIPLAAGCAPKSEITEAELNRLKNIPLQQELTSGDWLRWRGPSGNGFVPADAWHPEALNRPLKILWESDLGDGYSGVAVKDNLLFTMGYKAKQDIVYCLNLVTGTSVWSFAFPAEPGSYPGPKSTPVIAGNTLYVFSQDGQLYALGLRTGLVAWQLDLTVTYQIKTANLGTSCSPVIAGKLLLINAGRAGLALDAATGSEVWYNGAGLIGYATPVLHNREREAAFFNQQGICSVELATGRILWSYPWKTKDAVNAADPLIIDHYAFISSNYGEGCLLLDFAGNQPRPVWQNKHLASQFSSFIYYNGHIYGNDGSAEKHKGSFRCLDLQTGKLQWQTGKSMGSLLAVGKRLLLLNEKGQLSLAEFNPAAYTELATAALPAGRYWNPPVIVRNRLLVRNHKGRLFCIDAGPGV